MRKTLQKNIRRCRNAPLLKQLHSPSYVNLPVFTTTIGPSFDQAIITEICEFQNHTCVLCEVERADERTSPAVRYQQLAFHLITRCSLCVNLINAILTQQTQCTHTT